MRSKDSPRCLRMPIARWTSFGSISDRPSIPHWRRFLWMSRTACLPFSTKKALFAPRLRASIPKFPVPAKRSRTTFSCTSSPRMLKIDSFTRSEVGRMDGRRGVNNLLPLDAPLMIRIFIKICQNNPQLCWGDEWPTLSPGGRGLG